MTKGTRSKREMILEAAYDLFLNKGYWDTKIIDIADKAVSAKELYTNILKARTISFSNCLKQR